MDFAVNLVNELLSPVMHHEVNCPLLGVQSQAWWGEVTFPGWAVLSGTFLSEGPSSLGQSVAPCPPSLSLAWEMSRGLILAEINGPTLETFTITTDCQ